MHLFLQTLRCVYIYKITGYYYINYWIDKKCSYPAIETNSLSESNLGLSPRGYSTTHISSSCFYEEIIIIK